MDVFQLKKNFSLDEIPQHLKPLKEGDVHLWISNVSDPFYQNSDNKKKIAKKIISEYIKWDPKQFSFLKNENGKPYLTSEVNEENLQFNISHSGDYLVLAVAKNSPVGVDIEKHRSEAYFEKISKKYFSDIEREYLILNQQIVPAKFFEIWTAKEAGVKNLGGSFFKDVSQIQFDPFKKEVLKLAGNNNNPKWYQFTDIENYSLSVIVG